MKIPTLAKVCGRRPGAPEMFYRVNPYLFLVKPRRDVGFKLRAQGRSGTTRTGWKRRLGAGVKNPGAGGGRTLTRGQKRAVWPDSGTCPEFQPGGGRVVPGWAPGIPNPELRWTGTHFWVYVNGNAKSSHLAGARIGVQPYRRQCFYPLITS